MSTKERPLCPLGATGAAVNEAFAGELSKIKDSATRQWASAVIGAAASKAIGGDAQTGASTAVSGTVNNSFWDMTGGFAKGAAEGFIGDVEDTWNLITSPREQLKQLGEVAQAIWEIGKTPGGFSDLFSALGDEFKAQYQTILAIPDKDERDYQLGQLVGSGVYFAATSVGVPEKLAVKFPGLVSKVEKIKVLAGVSNYTGKIVWPNVPHANKTPGHWETIVQKAEMVAKRDDVAQVYVNKGLSNVTELNNIEPNRRPDIMVVRTDGKIDQYEVLSKTDNRESILERLLDNQRILGDKAGKFYILEPND
ncbi:hypothetical protein [Sporomusa sphaeroides]|uniref:hypothetical protein n=1 Tax=Sporomusa sphaeroides TaxID=47679 RepID=UPI002C9DE812|nr:hypothetical protein [Sporomusa sphaeroides]HML35656.1 hypothetical protein [Sporomusa sphaeroides]